MYPHECSTPYLISVTNINDKIEILWAVDVLYVDPIKDKQEIRVDYYIEERA